LGEALTLGSYQQALKLDRALRSAEPDTRSALRLVLAGNANMDFLAPALRVQLADEGITAHVRAAAFGNWMSETFDSGDGGSADVWVVWLSGMGATRGMTTRPEIEVAELAAAAQRLLDRGTRVILVHPEALPVEDDPFSPFSAWRQELVARLRLEMPREVVHVSLEHLVRRLGMASWAASRYWEQAKAPCHPDAATSVGVEIAVVIARLLRPAVRAVAVDLDDTLWGGLVGEVGAHGLDLDPDGTGRAFLEMQRLLLDLSARGIPVGVVSKNDRTEALSPFSDRPEMLTPLDMFVRFDASWEPKYEAIAAFAAQLNIGIDAVCFLDDSAKERDEARRMLPGLIVPELPESPARRVEYLVRSRLFTAPVVSDEDRLRVEFFKRNTEPVPADLDAYLGSLAMTLEASPVGPDNAERAVSLLHKTNQFNLSLWRPGHGELTEFVSRDENYAYVFRLVDRLGDAGIIAVMLAEPTAHGARIVGWVMSCRVFSRGVEWAVAEHLARWMRDRDLVALDAPFRAGPRNALLGDIMTQLGLAPGQVEDGVTWFSAERLLPPAHHITIVDR
jgi:FkbH-like protein